MTEDEFGEVMKPFYTEFAYGGETPMQRATTYQTHINALIDLPADAVRFAVQKVVREWTDEKRRPRVGMIRAIAQEWMGARLRQSAPADSGDRACQWCNATVGTREGSESPRLLVQHEPKCTHYDPDLRVVPAEPSGEDWRTVLARAMESKKAPTTT